MTLTVTHPDENLKVLKAGGWATKSFLIDSDSG